MYIDELCDGGNLPRRKAIVFLLFAGLLLLSVGSAALLFRLESRVLPELIGDANLGILFAAILEISKPVLSLVGWFTVLSRLFRPPSTVKIIGLFCLPILLWTLSSFCVFASVSLALTNSHLAEVREADMAAVIAQCSQGTNLLYAHAGADLRSLDDRFRRQREKLSSALVEASNQFKQQEQTLRRQLLSELEAAAAEPDFEKNQKLTQQKDLLIQRDRDALRDELHARKQQVIRDRDVALEDLNRRKQMLLFRADTTGEKSQVTAAFQHAMEKLEREFDTKDSALRAQHKSFPIATSSHATVAASIQASLDSLERTYQSVQSDCATRERADDIEISRERQGIQERLQKAIADSSVQLTSEMEGINTHDYSGDRRVQSKLLNDTLTTIHKGFGLNVSAARFITIFALLAALGLEGVSWVATAWGATALVGIFLGLPVDPEADLKKNSFATESGSTD